MLTPELVSLLNTPFAIADHEQREGSRGTWLTYITEEPLIVRLSAVDPNWEFRITNIRLLDGGAEPDVTEVFGELTIMGITRANVGTDAAKTEGVWETGADGKRSKTGERVMSLDENSTKAATTDTLKRCARLFGVGSYLLSVPRIKASSEEEAQRQFVQWYNRRYSPSAPKAEKTSDPSLPREAVAPAVPARDFDAQFLRNGAIALLLDWVLEQCPDLNGIKKAAGGRMLKVLKIETWTEAQAVTVGDAKAKLLAYQAAKCSRCGQPALQAGPFPTLCAAHARQAADAEAQAAR
jgi:hypothetical protein